MAELWERIVDLQDTLARVSIACAVMGSVSFVVGSIVGYQYHFMLLGKQLLDANKHLMVRWYIAAIFPSAVILFLVDESHSKPHYFLILAGLVVLFWFCWWLNDRWATRNEISLASVRSELFWSSITLSVVSAVTGILMVDQVFRLFHLRVVP